MNNDHDGNSTKTCSRVLALTGMVLALSSHPLFAQTYVSSEPIPSEEIVGRTNLARILNIGYPNLELWSQRLLNDCHMVQNVINVLSNDGSISTVTPGNTRFLVAAGGFEGVTDPTFVLTMADSGMNGASAADIFSLNNALGYVLNQSGTAQFTVPFDQNNAFEFPLDYAVVTHAGSLTGVQAMQFFNYLGTIDPALWSGANAGFTQINFKNSPLRNYLLDDSMLFLIGDVSQQEFVGGLFRAASTSPGMTYFPLNGGNPTTATAGAAFPGNDWVAAPGGDGYLVNIANPSPQLMNDLAALRQKHIAAVANLLRAINNGNVAAYLNRSFQCP